MIEVIRPFHSDVVKELTSGTRLSEAARMGTTAANIYYCTDYLAYQHRDNDDSPGICCQLILEREYEDEWNFAFTEWGRYIVNEPNTVWYAILFLNLYANLTQ
jgi:hypothetical protein